MLRKTVTARLLNVSGESPSYRAKPGIRNLLVDVGGSPYKEQFKDFWATPVPWQNREYGEKPKLGDPIPTRRAASTIIVAKNRHADPARVESGEDNDYKVLMHFREGKGRYVKDQFTFPGAPINGEDMNMESWRPLLKRRGLVTSYDDLHERLCAIRALLIQCNLLVIPKEGGGVAEVEGPPGPKKWHVICAQHPRHMRDLLDALELPLESVMSQLIPFRKVVTPASETFRFDNLNYIIPFDKIPCVQFTLSNVGEQLVWVSPMEALARFNAGIMNMPTPCAILLSELTNQCPTFANVTSADMHAKMATPVITPEIAHHKAAGGVFPSSTVPHADDGSVVSTILLPGDLHHTETTPEDREQKYLRRFVYEKDYPYGVRAVFEERPATEEEAQVVVEMAPAMLLEEANEMDMVYADTPYLKRQVQPTDVGKTLYANPEIQLQEGPEGPNGLVQRERQKYTGLEDDNDDSDMVRTTPALQRLRERSNPMGPLY
jgi:hypothetical protein